MHEYQRNTRKDLLGKVNQQTFIRWEFGWDLG
jgi:hypothetical protein